MANIAVYSGEVIGQIELGGDWLARRRASGAEGCGFDPPRRVSAFALL